MQRISIENFGPVKKFEADVTDIMLLIGPQASGKSTISKSIFIFKSLKDEILNYIYVYVNVNALENFSLSLNNTINDMGRKFFTYFGIEADRKGFTLKYQYSNEKYITISGSSIYNQKIKISSTLEQELNLLGTEILNYSSFAQAPAAKR
ncbi:AAA family ATPase [Trichormus sp. NMC-1]|uniref:AAA family ATPase n=1 Tax=Trichormus sp. NMC-1 TaxID=1853259 RepID=UPI0008DC08FF|nr:AAA family ATPase [Trichormus sp. NMC-1]